MIMANKTILGVFSKRGRPKRTNEVVRCNIHIDADIYKWLKDNLRGQTLTKRINDILREEAFCGRFMT